MESRSLEICVTSASGLKELNTIGKMDPYVAVFLSSNPNSKQKTEVDTDGGKNPKWKGKPMRFVVNDQNATLVFKIMAEKPFGDKEVGEVNVPVRELLEGDQSEKSLSYSVTTSGKAKGTLNFSLKVVQNALNENVGNKNVCEGSVAGYGPPIAAWPGYGPLQPQYSGAPYPPPPQGHVYPPPQGYPPQQGYPQHQGYPPQQGYPLQQGYPQQQGYPPQQGYAYPAGGPPPPGPYAYPNAPGYPPTPVQGGYAPPHQMKQQKNKKKSGGLGAIAAIGAGLVGGLILGDVASDIGDAVGDFDYGAGYEDASGAAYDYGEMFGQV